MEDDKAPLHIDRYRVLRALGRGGSGQVYQVVDTTTGEHLALKWLQVSGLAQDRFNREYEAAVRLNHPNIVRVFHYGRFEAAPWFTMELVDGVQAQKYVQQLGPAGSKERTREVLRIGACIADALHYLHHRKLVHRDVKSSNVMVLPDGRVKLLDFGTARLLDAEDITQEGEFVGTYAYASPEQCMGRPADSRSDLYNFGVFLYRLMTGIRPFSAEDPHELCRQHVEVRPEPLTVQIPDVDPELNALVMSCLAKRPEDRPSSARSVFKEIRKMAGEEPRLPVSLALDRSAGQLVGREEDFARLCWFLANADTGALCTIEALGQTDGQAFLGIAERQARGLEWRVFRCDLTEDLGLYRLALLLRQVGSTFQGSPPAQVSKSIETVASLCRSWGGEELAHQTAVVECGRTLFRERYLVDGRPVLVQLNQPGTGARSVWRVISSWAHQLVKDEVPIRFVVCMERNSTIPWDDCIGGFSAVHPIRLGALDEWQTGLLVGSLLHRRPPPPAVARRIHRASGGLPEYVEKVVENLVQNGLLESTQYSNRLHWAHSETLEMVSPVKKNGPLAQSLNALSSYGRRLLEVLTLAEQPLDAEELSSVLGWETEQVKPLLTTVSDEGWIERTEAGSWFLSNPLFGALVRAHMDLNRKDLHTAALSEVLRKKKPSRALVSILVELGEVEEAVSIAVELAAGHLAMLCPLTALEVLDLVIQPYLNGTAATTLNEEKLCLLFGRALAQTNPTDPRLQQVLNGLEKNSDTPDIRTGVLAARARIQRWLGHYPNYRKLLADAWKDQAEPREPKLASDVARHLGDSHAMAGEMEVAKKWYERGRDFAERADSDLLWAQSEVGRAGVLYAGGQFHEAEFSATRALEIFDGSEHLSGMSLAISTWANALRHQGRLSQALEVLAAAAPMLRASETPSFYLRILISMARCEMALGRLGRAQECLDELDAMVRPGEHLHLRLHVALVRSLVLLLSGQGHRSVDLLTEVIQKATGAGLLIEAEVGRSYLAEAVWEQQREKAIRYFRQSRERLIEIGHVPALLENCIGHSRAGRKDVRPDQVFGVVKDVLSQQPAELARMEWAIADALYMEAHGRSSGVSWTNAKAILQFINEQLNEIDRSSMQLHPWSRLVRDGMGAAQIPVQ